MLSMRIEYGDWKCVYNKMRFKGKYGRDIQSILNQNYMLSKLCNLNQKPLAYKHSIFVVKFKQENKNTRGSCLIILLTS